MHLWVCKWQGGLPLGDQRSHPESRVIGLRGGEGIQDFWVLIRQQVSPLGFPCSLFLSRWSLDALCPLWGLWLSSITKASQQADELQHILSSVSVPTSASRLWELLLAWPSFPPSQSV